MRPIRILYVLVTYVILQFCWWAYLLTEQSEEVFEQKTELARLRTQDPAISAAESASLSSKMTHRKWMVLGEGLVFLSLLLWGSFITYRSFRKE